MNWHLHKISGVMAELQSNLESGLSDAEACARLLNNGSNELVDLSGKSPCKMTVSDYGRIIPVRQPSESSMAFSSLINPPRKS